MRSIKVRWTLLPLNQHNWKDTILGEPISWWKPVPVTDCYDWTHPRLNGLVCSFAQSLSILWGLSAGRGKPQSCRANRWWRRSRTGTCSCCGWGRWRGPTRAAAGAASSLTWRPQSSYCPVSLREEREVGLDYKKKRHPVWWKWDAQGVSRCVPLQRGDTSRHHQWKCFGPINEQIKLFQLC